MEKVNDPHYDNKLIAKFMGYTYFPFNGEGVAIPGWKTHIDASNFPKSNSTHNFFLDIVNNKLPNDGEKWDYLCRKHDGLLYNVSWDWLMKVVKRISDILGQSDEDFYSALNETELWIQDTSIFCDHKTVYERVVEFIKFYNDYEEQSN